MPNRFESAALDLADVTREGITRVVELVGSVVTIETHLAFYVIHKNRDGLRPGMVTGIRVGVTW